MALEHLILTRQRDVDEMLACEQFREGILQIRLVAVPPYAKLLRRRRHHPGGTIAAAMIVSSTSQDAFSFV